MGVEQHSSAAAPQTVPWTVLTRLHVVFLPVPASTIDYYQKSTAQVFICQIIIKAYLEAVFTAFSANAAL